MFSDLINGNKQKIATQVTLKNRLNKLRLEREKFTDSMLKPDKEGNMSPLSPMFDFGRYYESSPMHVPLSTIDDDDEDLKEIQEQMIFSDYVDDLFEEELLQTPLKRLLRPIPKKD